MHTRVLCTSLLLAACQPPAPHTEVAHPFPEGFAWGAATAGFQVEMGCPTLPDSACLDTQSDWYQWVSDPAIVQDPTNAVSGEDVRHGPGMWETFEDDVALMKADGHTAFRMSIEWSRLFPEDVHGESDPAKLAKLANPAAVARYTQMLDALLDAGIEPFVTVNHYTLPLWVHNGVDCHQNLDCSASGWLDHDRIVGAISAYAGFLGATWGDKVDRWGTLNEPFATVLSGFIQPGEQRSSPPGRTFDGDGALATIRNQIDASAAMYDALHRYDTVDADGDGQAAEVGLVINMIHIVPKTDSEADKTAVAHTDFIYHRMFLDGLAYGSWDDDSDGVFDRTRDEIKGRLDWLGVNYYNQIIVGSIAPIHPLPSIPVFDFIPTFTTGADPEGLGVVLKQAQSYGLPLYVTENGSADEDQTLQRKFLNTHLASLSRAIDDGVDVRGYLWWSFVDNYEWSHGMSMKFGLYALDPQTKARTPRLVRDRFNTIIAQNGLE